MPTKRIPTGRSVTLQITPLAIQLFEEMRRLDNLCMCPSIDWGGKYWVRNECAACERWWELHSQLHDELQCKPWHWPAIENPDVENPYPPGSAAHQRWKPNLRGQAMWRALAAASREAKRARRAREAAAKVQHAAAPDEPA
jgi:hypothetical protein